MKICFLTNTMNVNSGYGRHSREIIERVNKFAEVTILTEVKSGYPNEIAVLDGASSLRNIFKLSKLVKPHLKDCDIIHALDVYPYGVIGTLAKRVSQKLIMTAHGTYAIPAKARRPIGFITSLIKRQLMLRAYRSASAVIAVSKYTRERTIKFSGTNNVAVINNGIDFRRFSEIKRIVHNNKVVLSVGIIKERKGYHVAIPAIAEATKSIPDLKYKIVGPVADEKYLERLKRMVKEFHLESAVEFLGSISDDELLNQYASSDLFLLPSINVGRSFEGFGLVFLEAAAAGLPVIGTKDNGIEDAVSDGYNGILVSQNNIKETAGAIIKILTDTDLANKFSENGRKWASEKDWDRVVEKYKEMYQNVL